MRGTAKVVLLYAAAVLELWAPSSRVCPCYRQACPFAGLALRATETWPFCYTLGQRSPGADTEAPSGVSVCPRMAQSRNPRDGLCDCHVSL